MRWLWFIGPLMVLATYLSVVLGGTTEDSRRKRYVSRWIDDVLGPLFDDGKKKLSRRVRSLPNTLLHLVEEAGGGARVADVVLVPQHAYLAVRAADGGTLSAHHTVLGRLKKKGPALVVRPLPIVDGRALENQGIAIDADFDEAFITEGENPKSAKKWLDQEVRAALLGLPEGWLRVKDDTFALTLYGALDTDRIDELVATADALFAHLGASDASLLGDGERARAPGAPKVSDVAEGEIAASDLRLRAGIVDFGLYGIAAFFVALTNGTFESFHPLALFTNPDVALKEPWQGGFTMKGFGAFTASLCLLVGLFVYQAYLAANHGRSIGKALVGLRIVREDDSPVDFLHAVVLRQWTAIAAVLAFAGFLVKPFSAGAMFARVVTSGPMMFAGGLVALGLATLTRDRDLRSVYDKLAGTKVVESQPVALPGVQLAASKGMDPVVFGQAMSAVGLGILFLVALGVVYGFELTLGNFPQEALALLVFVPLLLVQIVRASVKTS